MKKYELYKQGWKYYVVHSPCPYRISAHPNKFLSFYSKKRAKTALDEMNKAWEEGAMKTKMDILLQEMKQVRETLIEALSDILVLPVRNVVVHYATEDHVGHNINLPVLRLSITAKTTSLIQNFCEDKPIGSMRVSGYQMYEDAEIGLVCIYDVVALKGEETQRILKALQNQF
jgi:hypothetical protein